LTDDQIVSLWVLQGRPHLYSWIMGLLDIDSGRSVAVLSKDKLRDFLYVTSDSNNIMLLLQGGFIKRLNSLGDLEPVSRIPEDFFKTARYLHLVNGQPVVVADQGILAQDQTGRWLVSFFPSASREGRALTSLVGPDGQVYAALSNGDVFSASGKKITRLGSIDQKPRSMVFADTLWLAGTNQLYRLSGGSFVPVGPRLRETIIGFQPIVDKRLVVLATNFGIQIVPIP